MSIPLRQYFDLLAVYLQPLRRRVLVLAILVLAGIALQAANPQILAAFIDDALAGASLRGLVALAGAYLLVAVMTQACAVAATWISELVGWTATNRLRRDLADHCLRLDLSFHKTRTPGEMIQRIDGDIEALANFFSQFVLYVLGNVLLVGAVLTLLFLTDWRIGLTLGFFVVLTLGVLAWLRSLAVPRWLALREETAQFYGFLGEQLTGREDIRGNGARPYAMRRFREHLREWKPLAVRSGMGFAWVWMTSTGLFTLASTSALVLSYLLWQDGSLTIGTVYLVFIYTEMLRRPLDQIREQFQQLQAAGASIARVRSLFAIQSRLADTGTRSLPPGPLSVVFRDVSFAYDGDDTVLHGVDLALAPGEVLGLIGRSGSGKTTAGRLLARLYDAEEGSIELGGVGVRDVPLSELRGRVGVVSQDVQLMAGSVRDNLTLFDPSVPDEALLAALDKLSLAAWLAGLPAGLDSQVSAGEISAGEAQLLATARVLLKDPGLVVLDEATSRLDPATQRLVDGAMTALLQGRTAIVIAHRLSTLERADKVAVLDSGRLVEFGERASLLSDGASRFAQLHRMELEALLA